LVRDRTEQKLLTRPKPEKTETILVDAVGAGRLSVMKMIKNGYQWTHTVGTGFRNPNPSVAEPARDIFRA
jgi:hypothetical protein